MRLRFFIIFYKYYYIPRLRGRRSRPRKRGTGSYACAFRLRRRRRRKAQVFYFLYFNILLYSARTGGRSPPVRAGDIFICNIFPPVGGLRPPGRVAFT